MALRSSDWFALFFVEANDDDAARALSFSKTKDGFAWSLRSQPLANQKLLSFLIAGSNISGIENHIAELFTANVKGVPRLWPARPVRQQRA